MKELLTEICDVVNRKNGTDIKLPPRSVRWV